MGTVRNILLTKGGTVHSVDADICVYDALEKLEDLRIGALVVLEEGRYAGVFTERDYARKVILKGRSSKDTRVRDIMDRHPTLHPDTSVEDCMKMMIGKHFRHLPVEETGELVGLISIGDVVKHIIDEKQFIIEHLEHYITS
ncbi:MAG: CBS domain-containing protein [Panacibacter sp.]